MKEKFKEYIENLLQINLKLNSLLKDSKISPKADEEAFSSFQNEIKNLLREKNSFIQKLEDLKKSSKETFSEIKNSEHNESWQSIQELEKENLDLIKTGQTAIKKELAGLTRHSKAISSYKFNKEVKPKIVDDQF